MRDRPSRELVDALRRAVDQVERNTDLAPDDPALVHLKKILVLRIAALKGADTAPDSIKSCTPLATAAIQDDEPLCATRKRLGLSSEAHSKLVSEAFPMLASGDTPRDVEPILSEVSVDALTLIPRAGPNGAKA